MGVGEYLIHILCRVGSILDDDSLVPGQRVENGVLIHIRHSLSIKYPKINGNSFCFGFNDDKRIFTGWV